MPVVFISSVTGKGINELKDVLWRELNAESNKLQEITAEDTLVHRDKDVRSLAQEIEDEGVGTDDVPEDEPEDDVEDLEDFEYIDE